MQIFIFGNVVDVNLDIAQAFIIGCTCVAAWYISKKDTHRKWGFWVGLVGQPFWLWSTITTEPIQSGVLFVSLFYTVCYVRGIRNHFSLTDNRQKNGAYGFRGRVQM